jgi:exodeoxyribonuclease VII small subunit
MAKSPTAKTYQQLSDEFTELVAWFESENVNLDEAILKYEQSMELLKQMESYLKTAENKIKTIAAKFGGE